MEQSNTIEFKTTGGATLQLRPFITGRQALTLTEVTGDTLEKKNIALTHRSMELVIVSLNGDEQNIVERVKDLPFTEYMEIAEKVTEIASGKKKEENTTTT